MLQRERASPQPEWHTEPGSTWGSEPHVLLRLGLSLPLCGSQVIIKGRRVDDADPSGVCSASAGPLFPQFPPLVVWPPEDPAGHLEGRREATVTLAEACAGLQDARSAWMAYPCSRPVGGIRSGPLLTLPPPRPPPLSSSLSTSSLISSLLWSLLLGSLAFFFLFFFFITPPH